MFFEGFTKTAMAEVSKVGIFHEGNYLMGVRQDTGKWTEPGGHLKPKEDPLDGAIRECKEETGLRLSKEDVEYLGSKVVTKPDGGQVRVHAYRSDILHDVRTRTDGDPDHEVFGWNWVPVKGNKLPISVESNLHVPAKNNVLHFFLGFERSARATVK